MLCRERREVNLSQINGRDKTQVSDMSSSKVIETRGRASEVASNSLSLPGHPSYVKTCCPTITADADLR